jgi:alpha-1,2-mannosyltransferase
MNKESPVHPAPALRAVTTSRVTMALLMVVLALGVGIAIQSSTHLAHRIAKDPTVHSINDFHRWWAMIPHFVQQHADYVDDDFPNPPIVIAVLAPFTHLSAPAAQLCWTLLKTAMAIAILWLCISMVERAGIQLHPAALVVAVVAWLCPLAVDMQQGNTNLLMLLPLCAGLWAAQCQTPRRDLLAGVLVAFAVSVKVTPLIFLIYFLLRRRWYVVAGMIVGLPLWLLVVPGIAFGWAQNLLWLQQWTRIMIVPFVMQGHVVYSNNQSLPSLLLRLLGHVAAFDSNHPGHAAVYINLANLAPHTVAWITRGLLVVLGLSGLFWMRRTLANFKTPHWILEIGAVCVFMLWASERTWEHHYVTEILALLATAMVCSLPSAPPRLRHWAMTALVLCAIFANLTTDAARIIGADASLYARAYGAFVVPSFLLIAVLVFASRHLRQPMPSVAAG